MGRPKNPKDCVDCGAEFWPKSGRQVRCDPCRAKPKSQRPKRAPGPKATAIAPKREIDSERRVRAPFEGRVSDSVKNALRRIDEESYERMHR